MTRYPDHPLDQNRRLEPITRDMVLPLVDPTVATTHSDLIAAWRALAPMLRRRFPLPFSGPDQRGSDRVFLANESLIEAVARVKAGTVVSLGERCDFGSIEAVDYEQDPTGINLEWPWQLNRLNGFWDVLAWASEQGDADARAALLSTVRRWLTIPIPLEANGYASRAHRTIDTGIRLANTLPRVLPTLLDHGDDDLLIDLLCSLFLQQERLRWNHRTNNWLTMEMNGLLTSTVYLPFNRRNADYQDYAIGIMHASLAEQVLNDHTQIELSPSYQMVCVHNFVPLVERAQWLGIVDPCLDIIAAEAQAMVRAMADLLLSTGLCAEPQDSDRVTVAMLRRYVPDLAVPTGFTALPNAGYAVLRQGEASVFVDLGPYGAAHQHQDALNLVYSVGPRPIVIEYGKQTYENSDWRRLCLSSAGHNCLLVDGTGQWRTGPEQRLPYPPLDVRRRDDASGCSVVGRYAEPYGEHLRNMQPGRARPDDANVITGIEHERAVHLVSAPGFAGILVVEDRVRCSTAHRLTLLWHLNSDHGVHRDDQLTFTVDGLPVTMTWWSDHRLKIGTACGREGGDGIDLVNGAPAGWSNLLDHRPQCGAPRPRLRLDCSAQTDSWRMLTAIAVDDPAGTVAIADDASGIVLTRGGQRLVIAPRLLP